MEKSIRFEACIVRGFQLPYTNFWLTRYGNTALLCRLLSGKQLLCASAPKLKTYYLGSAVCPVVVMLAGYWIGSYVYRMATSQDAWYLSLLGFAEYFRTCNPPDIKKCIQCLHAVFTFKPPSRVEARTFLQLGNILLTHTKNVDLARNYLEQAVSKIMNGLNYDNCWLTVWLDFVL